MVMKSAIITTIGFFTLIMGLTREVACKILKLQIGATKQKAINHFKVLALQHFPSEEHCSEESLKIFQELCEAACVLLDIKYPAKLELKDMLSLFQLLFFKDASVPESDEEVSDSYEEDSEECESLGDVAVDTSGSKKSTKSNTEDNIVKNGGDAMEIAKELIQEEEKAKKKAVKKKSQKKKRKERKKKEKEEEKKLDKKSSPKKEDESETDKKTTIESSSSESEEDIDTNSAFVAVIAKKKNRFAPIPSKKASKQATSIVTTSIMNDPLPKEDPTARILRSRELALRGNQMANSGHYVEAIELFTEAIKLEPGDHRFYGNRSYCYDRIGHYDRALRDADKSISMLPDWPKGHFRKGRALANLKKFSEAEICFNEVLRLDPDCDDAVKEQLSLRVVQLMDMGFGESQAETALEEYGNVDRALEYLLTKCPMPGGARNDVDIFFSDEDDEIIQYFNTTPSWSSSLKQPVDVKMDPNNPENLNSLWVGNIQPDVTESLLNSLFSKYGELLSIKLMSEKYCAFVNFKHPKSAGLAMRALQSVEVCGVNILIRFPNVNGKPITGAKSSVSSPTTSKVSKEKITIPGDECYFWRTTGCVRGHLCKYKHVQKNKGIDIDKVFSKP